MRHVLVTGAASGLGRAIAEDFAEHEYVALTLVDIDGARLADAPVEAVRITADLTEPEACESVEIGRAHV